MEIADSLPMEYLTPFSHWLQNQQLTASTVRNYLVDVNRYLNWIKNQPDNAGTPLSSAPQVVFSSDCLSRYIKEISGIPNAPRYLASLTKFCQFAYDQQLINSNPIKKLIKDQKTIAHSPSSLTLADLVKIFQDYLSAKNKTKFTIKNYINDLIQYINYCQLHPEDG